MSLNRGLLRKYCGNTQGHFAVWFALLALPLAVISTFVLDYGKAGETRIELKAALDATALAAVTKQNVSEAERKIYAQTYFDENFSRARNFKLSFSNTNSKQVDLEALGKSPVSVAKAIGFDDLNIREKSSAIVTSENVVCVMTLNSDGKESFYLGGGAVFHSPSCAVQVNSNHKEAAVVSADSRATAKDFCVVGGTKGAYTPYANTECSKLDDPYADHHVPANGPCVNFGTKGPLTRLDVGDNVILAPGTYCGDIWVSGKNVLMLPGTYIMNGGEIWVRNGSSVNADQVSIVLKGKFSRIFIEQGSQFKITAPSLGPMAGLAIFQDKAATLKETTKLPSGSSEISGGSKMSIVGTVYLPTQTISIFGDSGYDNTSPATAYIGYNVRLGSGANLSVRVNHTSAGLPPILPRSDEGARLVH